MLTFVIHKNYELVIFLDESDILQGPIHHPREILMVIHWVTEIILYIRILFNCYNIQAD